MMDLSCVDRGAEFSECQTYRYRLWRIWDEALPKLIFIMLNPSTADMETNDPTVERCERRAWTGNYGGLIVVNLMAYRSTDPKVLKDLAQGERFGPNNAEALEWALSLDGDHICGWGKDGHLGPVAWLATRAARAGVQLLCLHKNKDGSPAHPLYQPYSKQPTWWAGASE